MVYKIVLIQRQYEIYTKIVCVKERYLLSDIERIMTVTENYHIIFFNCIYSFRSTVLEHKKCFLEYHFGCYEKNLVCHFRCKNATFENYENKSISS